MIALVKLAGLARRLNPTLIFAGVAVAICLSLFVLLKIEDARVDDARSEIARLERVIVEERALRRAEGVAHALSIETLQSLRADDERAQGARMRVSESPDEENADVAPVLGRVLDDLRALRRLREAGGPPARP